MNVLKKISLDLIGRNDPCLCGSGIKFKKCCLNKSDFERRLHFENKDTPLINDWFFYYHSFQEFSAATLMYADLTMPELQGLASSITRELIARGEAEGKIIRMEQNPLVLLDKLGRGTDNIHYSLLIKRLLEYQEQVTPLIIHRLRDAEDDVFIEQSVRYLNQIPEFPQDQIEELAERAKSPYTRSSLCLLLGVKGTEAVLPVIWRQYHLLRVDYPKESYMQGPFYGLYDYGCRFGLLSEGVR